MTDHLPECRTPMTLFGPRPACICPELRACEQRVLEDERALIAVEQTTLAELNAEQRALDAAREAVERVSTLFEPLGRALAAIDGLRATNP